MKEDSWFPTYIEDLRSRDLSFTHVVMDKEHILIPIIKLSSAKQRGPGLRSLHKNPVRELQAGG